MWFSEQDYREEVQRFAWAIPPDYNIVDEVEGHALRDPDKPAILWEDAAGQRDEVSFSGLMERARRLGSALIKLGVKKGDPVIHLLPRTPAAPITQLGTFFAGGIAVPCSEMLKPDDIGYRAVTSGAKVIVAHVGNAGPIEKARKNSPLTTFIVAGGKRPGWIEWEDVVENTTPVDRVRISADDPMTINFTSGTTGRPKPVVHKHRWIYCHNCVTARYWWGMEEDDLVWATTAPGWAKWYWSPIGSALASGVTQLLYNGRFDPERYLELLERYKVTKLCATPTEYRLFSQLPGLSRYSLPLKDAVSAGEPLNAEPIEAFKRAFGVQIRDGYGQTESVCLACNYPGLRVKPGSMGVPTPGTGLTLIDEKGVPVNRGEVGELAVRPDNPAIFDGYWTPSENDEGGFSGGWYRTGDLARMDEDGYLFFEGRADDVIITSGYRIGPFEVEDALVSHPAVVEAAAIAAPHRERGEIVKAFVVLAKGYEPSEKLIEVLQGHVKGITAPYKYPRAIQFVDKLPKTMSGKIKRAQLKEKEWRGWRG
jgi:acetyl-CoA synthetase